VRDPSKLGTALSRALARLIVHRPARLAGGVIALVLACAWIIQSRQNFDTEVLNLLPKQFDSLKGLKVLNSEFNQARELTFALRGEPEAVSDFSEHFITNLLREKWVLRALTAPPLESADEIDRLGSLLPTLLLNLEAPAFAEAIKLLEPEAMEQRLHRLRMEIEAGSAKAEMQLSTDPLGLLGAALKPIAGKHGLDQFSLTSPAGTMRLIPVVTNQPSLSQADCKALMNDVETFIRSVRESYDAPAPEVLVTGRSAYVAQISSGMRHDVTVTSTVSIVMVAGLFYLGFRRFLPLLGIIATLGLSCFLAFSFGSLAFENLNMIAIAFCSILVGLGDDFSLLLYTRYLQARTASEAHEQAIATSILEVGPGILYVCAATGIGFLALLLSGSAGFAQLGTLIAIGIVLCGMLMLSVFFLFIRPQFPNDRPDPFGNFVAAYVKRVVRAPWRFAGPMIGLFIAVVAVSLLPLRTLKFDTSPRSLEPKNSAAAIALKAITEGMAGAAQPVVVMVDATTPEQSYDRWSKLNSHFEALVEDGVLAGYSTPLGFIISPARVRANQATLSQLDLTGAQQAFEKILVQEGFEPSAFVRSLELFPKLEAAAFSTTTPNLKQILPPNSSWWFLIDRYLSILSPTAVAYLKPSGPLETSEAQDDFEQKLRASGVPMLVTGWSYAMVSLVPWAKHELILFSSIVGMLILILLGIAYRQWKPWIIHTGSLAFAIAGTIATLKVAGVQINMLNALAFPLILGVGVDYGLHVLFAARERSRRDESLLGVIKPLVICGLTTITGFGSLMLARNPALSGLGTVCALGVAWCLASSLLFVLPLAVASNRQREL
jgi:predicted RND superfamily exporter protein